MKEILEAQKLNCWLCGGVFSRHHKRKHLTVMECYSIIVGD